ncbi:MAG TPA: hypothetical protein VM425_11920 [Myxococcota bacterium]|nr:hypothetical protein [Myxococcota bacterium]
MISKNIELLLASVVAVLLAGTGWAPADNGASSTSNEINALENGGAAWDFWFNAQEEYRLRAVVAPGGTAGDLVNPAPDSETDNDLRLFLEGGLRDPSDHFGGEFALGLWWDVDGVAAAGDSTGLGSMFDYRQPWWDVYKLQLDYQSDGFCKLARAGRQAAPFGLPVTFDGAAVVVSAVRPILDLFIFGGRSVHFFETQADMFEDWLASAGAVIRPLRWLRIELDYRLQIEDVLQADRVSKADLTDHSYGVTSWYRPTDWLLGRLTLRGLNNSFARVGAAARLEWKRIEAGIQLSADAQTISLDEIHESADPFFTLLGESLPNLRWQADAWKRFSTAKGNYTLHLGWNGRQVLNGDPGPFNRNMGRAYLLFDAADVILPGIFFSLSGEGHYTYLNGSLLRDWIFTAGGSAGYKNKKLSAELGTYYQRYKYDYYRDVREVSDVRTFYASCGFRPLSWLSFRVRYEFERSDRDFHVVTLSIGQMFQ